MGFLIDLVCTKTDKAYSKDQLWNLSPEAEAPLFARYDLDAVAKAMRREKLAERVPTMWRYAEVLPVENEQFQVSLGEGFTPLLQATSLGRKIGVPKLYIKDEGLNPTGSFKARGMSAAISRAAELGAQAIAIPSAGNAGGATAAYAARAGLPAHIFMPKDVPQANYIECKVLGAHVELIDGLISDCGKIVASRKEAEGWFDISTLKEPYRVEGKKTMGYELAEQFDWELPEVVIYPTGGGTGLIGMWKAFDEMEQMGWIGPERPRMISVQAAGCAPIVRAYSAGDEHAEPWIEPETIAAGLRVPAAVGDFLMLKAIRDSGGCALSVTDEELMASASKMAVAVGSFPAPEGAATLSALEKLIAQNLVSERERVVLFNTGTGLKYIELFQ
ncbi:MAG: threonine synthase [Gemmatimonadetes bacterium]|nr:threonine synthase [Gemmatimonadota bacterium]MYF72367.1 threonine synthase [Gemmatimonadota bacterium]MYK52213.1 threonine synthase [Gemmatimonadota bacterium]